MKAGPVRAAVVFILVHLRAVAVLVRALRRLVGIIFTYLLVLLLFFNAGEQHGEIVIRTCDHIITLNHSWVERTEEIRELWSRHLQGLWRRLCCTAVTLVSRSISEGSIHLLLEDMRQGVQWDAAQRGGVEVSVVAVKSTSLKIYHSQLFISITLHQHIADVIVTFCRQLKYKV